VSTNPAGNFITGKLASLILSGRLQRVAAASRLEIRSPPMFLSQKSTDAATECRWKRPEKLRSSMHHGSTDSLPLK
jgi:hypothetical protein